MQDEWWYSIGDARKGPASLDALRQLLLEGKVAKTTLVWKEGLASWAPISEVPDLQQQVVRAVPPELPKPTAREHLITLPLAGPWRRFFARLVDLWVIALPTGFVVARLHSFCERGYAGEHGSGQLSECLGCRSKGKHETIVVGQANSNRHSRGRDPHWNDG